MRLLLLVAALACASGANALRAQGQAPSTSVRIPVAKFASLPAVRKPVLSPDGHRIAARKTADGNSTIILLDADKPGAAGKAIPLGKAHVFALRWAGNNRLLITVQTSRNFGGDYEVAFLRLIAIDLATGYTKLVDQKSRGIYTGDVLYTDPTGSWALVASQDSAFVYPSVKRVDLDTGDAKLVERARDGVWDWYADDQGVLRAGIAYEGNRWTIWYREQPNEKLKPIRGKFPKDDSTVDRFIFRGQNSWVVTNERTGRFGLYKYDLKSQTIGQAIFEHPEVDLEDVYYDALTGDVAAVEYQDDRSHMFWLEPDMKALQAKIDKALPNAVNITVGWSRDEKRALVWSASAADPGRYFLLDRATSQMHPVVETYPDIDPEQLAPVKPIRYQARDGLGLRGYLTLPRGRDPKGLPLIIMPHGGPFARDDWEYDPFVQFFANRGYAVLQPQFRGSTGFGKDFVSRGYGEIGKKMQDDLDDGVDWLAKSGQIDPKRVCIVGFSYGGYAAMWGAIRNPERYRCAVSWAGPSDLPAMMRYDRKLFSAIRYFREWRSRFPSKDDMSAVSPINFADRLKVPLLIGHGEEDANVQSKQSHRMVDALHKAGANVTPIFYKESEHSFGSSKDLEDWLKRLEAFLAKNNPA